MIKREKQTLNSGDNGFLEFLYKTRSGRMLLKLLTVRWISKTAGYVLDRGISKIYIKPFIRKNGIDLTDFEDEKYASFNEFFTRRVKNASRPVADDGLISPCDGWLTVHDIDNTTRVKIKGRTYSISELLCNEELAKEFTGGQCLVFRLTVSNYHHYCYIDSGTKGENIFIKGVMHTVQPIACGETDVYKENCREYTIIDTESFGKVIQIEIGAMMVGRICNLHGAGKCGRGEEKGKFEFGGSTIVLLMKKGTAEIDSEFNINTAEGFETAVKYGEKIGEAI